MLTNLGQYKGQSPRIKRFRNVGSTSVVNKEKYPAWVRVRDPCIPNVRPTLSTVVTSFEHLLSRGLQRVCLAGVGLYRPSSTVSQGLGGGGGVGGEVGGVDCASSRFFPHEFAVISFKSVLEICPETQIEKAIVGPGVQIVQILTADKGWPFIPPRERKHKRQVLTRNRIGG